MKLRKKKTNIVATTLHSWWQKIKQYPFIATAIIVAFLAFIVFTFAAYTFGWDWTGFNGYTQVTTQHTISGPSAGTVVRIEMYQPGKAFWDWLQLLIIPVVLAITALLFNGAISRNEQKLTIQRDKTAHNLAVDTQREDRLQAYLDRMSELLLTGNLRKSGLNADVRYIARARTLTVLSQLEHDRARKKTVLQFLYESNLIKKNEDSNIVDLEDADLSEGNYSLISLRDANLRKVYMTNAVLDDVDLSGADISDAVLSESNFANSKLSWSNLKKTYIQSARLTDTDLHNADMSHTQLTGSDLTNANLSGANLSGANLSSFVNKELSIYSRAANLTNANLSTAILTGADLTDANLTGANLSKADLSYANLARAKVNPEQLAKAKSLKGATMPDGSKHP